MCKTSGGGTQSLTPAFTLAEVLITLGIIGVVASLTIPAMITDYKKQQTVVQLKKAYSNLSNAFQTAQAEHGPISTWSGAVRLDETRTGSDESLYAFVNTYLSKYLKISAFKLRPENIYPKGSQFFTGINSGSNLSAGGKTAKWFYLEDGTCFRLSMDNDRSGNRIFYDINGDKGPNIVGKDIFAFDFGYFKGYKLKFLGLSSEMHEYFDGAQNRKEILNSTCSKTNGGYYGGNGCGWVIQYDGWQISPDYPW